MSLKKFLLKLARRVVDEVLSKITSQLSIVEDTVMNGIKTEVAQLVGEGKGFWGPAAERHAAEMTGKVIPQLGQLANTIGSISINTRQAQDIIHSADQAAKGRIEDLASKLRAIYRR